MNESVEFPAPSEPLSETDKTYEGLTSVEACVKAMEDTFLADLNTRTHGNFLKIWSGISQRGAHGGEEETYLRDYFTALSPERKMQVMALVAAMDNKTINGNLAQELIANVLFEGHDVHPSYR